MQAQCTGRGSIYSGGPLARRARGLHRRHRWGHGCRCSGGWGGAVPISFLILPIATPAQTLCPCLCWPRQRHTCWLRRCLLWRELRLCCAQPHLGQAARVGGAAKVGVRVGPVVDEGLVGAGRVRRQHHSAMYCATRAPPPAAAGGTAAAAAAAAAAASTRGLGGWAHVVRPQRQQPRALQRYSRGPVAGRRGRIHAPVPRAMAAATLARVCAAICNARCAALGLLRGRKERRSR